MNHSHNKYWDFNWFLGSLQVFLYQTFGVPSPECSLSRRRPPPQKKKQRKCIILAPLSWKNLLYVCFSIIIKCIIKQENYSRRWSNTGFGAEAQRWGGRTPHYKTCWRFVFQVQILRSLHVYDISKVIAYTPVLV